MTQTPAFPARTPSTEERLATAPGNLGVDSITGTVLSQIHAPDPRMGQLATSLVTHLHDFIRENQVTWDEWMTGLDFLARAGHWTSATRNEFILLSDTSGSSTLVDALNNQGPANMTPTTVEGPFHSAAPPRQMGEVIATEDQWNRGDWTLMHGRVLSPDGTPVPGARIDIWQADQVGRYDVQDPGMQPGDLRALLTTGSDGRYWFRTVKPSSYPVPTDGPGGEWLRATGRQPMRPGAHPRPGRGRRLPHAHHPPVRRRRPLPRCRRRLWRPRRPRPRLRPAGRPGRRQGQRHARPVLRRLLRPRSRARPVAARPPLNPHHHENRSCAPHRNAGERAASRCISQRARMEGPVGTGDFYNQGYATRTWVEAPAGPGPRGDISLHDGGHHENPVAARGRLVASGR